ncbi:MAG: shikimate dehydrogenase [Paenibacillus macerans]|uniref:Shikimate dehydrogenase (NADP(+)) n=1 Tax=Paenibacillus macerans TaxID=44252 RepID=A0A091A0P4_PAEMA|nr:shikimate dehydrogenase [Paenibacillus macerans]KFN09901.1 shikimate 5-dehydrogenase [Paenibacillus macerans]MCY7560986.1 shikimate dehydrogenase [Paenibacillus macerans]MDU7475907.1 shikimate dehydrogenase [Paenibacillus macerans]MEC0138099.1 shikimate dehydrogenase [Paenibacillus macerans]MEC0153595.1 shikimate dehydrogenase [Paenibacillus macerans]
MNGQEQMEKNKLPLLLGVIGDPIGHSKSPAMHEAALKACGLAGAYLPFHVKGERLKEAVQGIAALGFRGINVTVPHKLDVMKYLDRIDEGARYIGAVNTVVNDGGTLTGYNTDGIGYIRSLKEETVPDLTGKTAVVLGAGGAARGIIYALLLERPAHVIVANRTADKARELAAEWAHLGRISGCGMEEAAEYLQAADIVINTTSAGMYPHVQETPIDPALLPGGIVVSDLIYNPLKTELLRRAEMKDCTIHSGFGMFIYQGAYAFEHWTGLPAPIEAMRAAVMASMGIAHLNVKGS